MKKELNIELKMKSGSSNRKRKYILEFCLVSFVLLTGYAFYKPELINAKKPFIELSGSIGTSIGNAEKAYDYEHPKVEPAKSTPTPVNATPTPVKLEVKTQVEIIVSGEAIAADNRKVNSIDEFESVIRSKDFDELSFILVDDYAEAKTYKTVVKVLDDAGKKYKPQMKE